MESDTKAMAVRTCDRATQAYAAWAMLSKATQTGVDLRYRGTQVAWIRKKRLIRLTNKFKLKRRYYDSPVKELPTRTARPWSCNRYRRFRAGVATQATIKKRSAHTQTPQKGPAEDGGKKKSHNIVIEASTSTKDKAADMSWEVLPEFIEAAERRTRVDKPIPSRTSPRDEDLECSWEVIPTEGNPPVDIPNLNPTDPLGLLSLTEELIHHILQPSDDTEGTRETRYQGQTREG